MKNLKIKKTDLKLALEVKRANLRKNASKFVKGVYDYVGDLIGSLEDDFIIEVENIDYKKQIINNFKNKLLNGARNTHEFSFGGCSLIYDGDIAKRLCTASELKKKKYGRLQPTKSTTWLDVQARALFYAFIILGNLLDKLITSKYNYLLCEEFLNDYTD